MRKVLLWVLLIVAIVAYGLIVYGWWLEGNANRGIY